MARRKKNRTGIPDYVLDSLAEAMLPAIQKYFESEDVKKEFLEWQKEKVRNEKKVNNM